MSHYYEVRDGRGDLVDLVSFCSDWCHQAWCRETGNEYQGWNGCHEHEYREDCASCGEVMPGSVFGVEVWS